eukprot:COSAG05_NODE_17176_length_330_cov_0.861472_1_plen_93_part_01
MLGALRAGACVCVCAWLHGLARACVLVCVCLCVSGVDCVAHYICACISAALSRIPLPVAALAFLRSDRTLPPPLLLLLLPPPVVSFPTTFIPR